MKSRFFFILTIWMLAVSFHSNAVNAPIATIASITACPGGSINVPVTVVNFNAVASMSLTIDYDSTVVTFTSLTPNPLIAGVLVTSSRVGVSNIHRLSISWYKTSGSVTLGAGATLFSLNFNYINGSTALSFIDDDVQGSCEYAGTDLNIMNDSPTSTYYHNGSISSLAVSAMGTISGPQSVSPGTSGLVYSTTTIPGATSYSWAVPSGFTITSGSGTSSITVTATNAAVSGSITVRGSNTCGNGPVASIEVGVAKTLSLSILLESLYNGTGMNKAKNATTDQFAGTTADQISIELHSSIAYSTVIYTAGNVNLSTTGEATALIPAAYSATYYITVKHRNSIETTSAVPVSFSNGDISYQFNLPGKAYGDNLKLLSAGVYGIYAGDVNQDGVVDATDLVSIDNAAAAFLTGYVATDVNGNGVVNASDNTMAASNAASFVSVKKP
jgi:hypothetical protein